MYLNQFNIFSFQYLKKNFTHAADDTAEQDSTCTWMTEKVYISNWK